MPARPRRRRPSVHETSAAEVQTLESRALLTAVVVSAADNDAGGDQTVVLPADAETVTVKADGAYDQLTLDADGVTGDLVVILQTGVDLTGQLRIEADDAGSGAVTLRGPGGAAVTLAGELRFRGNGGAGRTGTGDRLGDVTAAALDLSLNGDATAGALVAASGIFLEATAGTVSVDTLTLTGPGAAEFAAEGDAVLSVGAATAADGDLRVDATGNSVVTAGALSAVGRGGDVRAFAGGRAAVTLDDLSAGREGAVELTANELSRLTAGDLDAGRDGTVRVGAGDGAELTAGSVLTRGDAAADVGGVAVQSAFAAVVTLGEIDSHAAFAVEGRESGGIQTGDVTAGTDVAVGLQNFAAAQFGAIDAGGAFVVDAAGGPLLLGAVTAGGPVEVVSRGDVTLSGTIGDDVLNLRSWDLTVLGTFTVFAGGGDDFVRLGEALLGNFRVVTGTGDDVVRTDDLVVGGVAQVEFGPGAGTLAAWYGSVGEWNVVGGRGDVRATFALGEVTGGMTLTGGDDRDVLVLTGATVGGRVQAETGAGRDTVVVRGNSTVGSVVAITGDDTDSIALVDSDVRKAFAVNAGGDADRISIARATIGGTTRLTAGAGNDQVRAIESSLVRLVTNAGAGKDRVRVQTTDVTDVMFADLGDDDDRLDVDRRSASATSTRLFGGDGFDRLVNGPPGVAREFERIV